MMLYSKLTSFAFKIHHRIIIIIIIIIFFFYRI